MTNTEQSAHARAEADLVYKAAVAEVELVYKVVDAIIFASTSITARELSDQVTEALKAGIVGSRSDDDRPANFADDIMRGLKQLSDCLLAVDPDTEYVEGLGYMGPEG